MSPTSIAPILKSLVPNNAEELSVLQSLVKWAQQVQASSALNGLPTRLETTDFLKALPAELHRYFHGLVEALEIYHSIHGEPVPVAELSLNHGSVRELKQIRDMCLEDGLHSIY